MSEHERRKSTSLKVAPGLWKRLRLRAVQEERTVSEIIDELITEYLKQPMKKGAN